MPRMTNIEMIQINEQPALTVRTVTRVEELPALIGESYQRIGEYMGELKELFSGVPFVAYHNLDMQNLDVEIGFPVAKPLPGKNAIRLSCIPAGKAIFCMYRGAYSEMAPVYEEMAKWITDNGCIPAGTAYEFYYNSPDFPESELLTKIMMPIR
jgi:effector-binding domain-containing protein